MTWSLYWRDRKIDGHCYHVDYCFVTESWTESISSVTVGRFDARLSEHVQHHLLRGAVREIGRTPSTSGKDVGRRRACVAPCSSPQPAPKTASSWAL